MDVKEIVEPEGKLAEPPPPDLIVAIAIKGNRKSKSVVEWTLKNFIPEGITVFKLLHVRSKVTVASKLMRNFIRFLQKRDKVTTTNKEDLEWQARKVLLPYKELCAQKKVHGDITVIESDDVAKAIAEEVANCSISKIVIGAASNSMFTRKHKKRNLSSRISACIPSFCTVYAVSKGKLSSIRPPQLATNGSIKDDSSDISCSKNSSSSCTSCSQTESVDHGSVSSCCHFCSSSLPLQRTLLHSESSSIEIKHSRCLSMDMEEGRNGINSCLTSIEAGHQVRRNSSYRSFYFLTDDNNLSEQVSNSDVLTCYSSNESRVKLEFEVEKLRTPLGHLQGMSAIDQSKAIDSSAELNNPNKHKLEEPANVEERHLKKQALESAKQEKEECEAARREAYYMMKCAEREVSRRLETNLNAAHDAEEKEELQYGLPSPVQQYQNFAWEEIESATSSFSDSLKIGMGAYGTVYKCNLHHTIAAVKILDSKGNHETKQFQQELKILSKIRHPHLLLLLGACPAHGCLVYEYMENGSLEDRLRRKNNTPPIPWFERFRIAWEVASALVFLHNSKPKPIVHRDMKPANILLDRNLVSKIGDVGLSTMVNSDPSSVSTTDKYTGPVGTLCYIDPEYQRTGLISPKSDVYAFGMVILQLLTSKEAIALAPVVESAINKDNLGDIIDAQAGNWPINETKEFAMLGMSCTELRQKDRPDLKVQVLPALKKLKEVADRARHPVLRCPSEAPRHFICPILKDVMNEPCVAADGYTYDRKAIEKWLEKNDKSPITNLPLENENLLPNYSLLIAIMEWKSIEH